MAELPVESVLHVAAVVPITTAEGPGRRMAIWVQGCRLRCPGCCNPALFAAGRGPGTPVERLLASAKQAIAAHGISGLTVLGGEPLEQLPGVTALCDGAARLGLGVIVFSGYRHAEALRQPGFDALWTALDTLVDGRFDATTPEPSMAQGGRRYIGSTNQTLHHRTERYRDPVLWRGPVHAEVHVHPDGRWSLHGEPATLESLLVHLRDKPPRSTQNSPPETP